MEDKPKSFFSLKHTLRLCRTVRYLKPKQVFYRIYYPVKKLYYRPGNIPARQLRTVFEHPLIQSTVSCGRQNAYQSEKNTFTFLNKTKSFGPHIDWNFQDFGLLWTFNLHYFNWLFAPGISVEKGLNEILQYIDQQEKSYFFRNSYIASYRIVNWIRFSISHGLREERVYRSLYQQSLRLAAFPEYEIMGNHLMENGIALTWAGLFFKDEGLLQAGQKILAKQLPEQVLPDGAHFEKSYAYHTILLKRLLELAIYYQQEKIENIFYKELIISISKMLSHVFVLNKSDDFPPLFGDNNENMNVSLLDLTNLAQNLPLKIEHLPLKESGMRRLEGENCTVFFNLGNIPASYQPGHAHADAFTFCLNVAGKPLLVDRGVSTYEVGAARMKERSTAAHNTIFVAGFDSSEVWASFRMGKRAKCVYLVDSDKTIECEHNGYFSNFEITHRRNITVEGKKVFVNDALIGWKGQEAGIAFHFYPGLQPKRNGKGWELENMKIEIEGADTYLEDYEYAKDFNSVLPAKRITGIVRKETIRTTIVLR